MSAVVMEMRASRILFGSGALGLVADETDRLRCERALLVSTPGRASLVDRAVEILGYRVAGSFAGAVPHVPEDVASTARDAAQDANPDCIVALGGSSAIGVAKAVALSLPVPIIAVPTTYGGSEMTSVYGLTRDGVKETARDPRVQPRVVIYDPELTLTLSRRTTASSGLNAIAHCIEAMYAPDANPLTSAAAVAGANLLFNALPALAVSPDDIGNRSAALEGAWLAGFALGTVQMGLHHKLAHVIGGSYGLTHADTHAVLLPYTAAFNRAALPIPFGDAPERLLALAKTIGAPLSLKELGLAQDDIGRAADIASSKQYPSPRAVTRGGLVEILTAAWSGDARYVEA